MKTCSVCKKEQPLDNYYNYKNTKDGKSYRCKECDNKARQKWTRDNRERSSLSSRSRNLKYKYGITLDDYQKLLSKQEGKCGCCGVAENTANFGVNVSLSFAVDHCHETGKVRGLLCNQCNRAVGMLGDTPEGVEKALNYLRKTH